MKIGILNEKHGIMVLEGINDLGHLQKEQLMREGENINTMIFFYMPDRDWIVLNKEHALYDFYSGTIPVYLELSLEARRECTEQAPIETIKQAWKILDEVIFRRQLLNGKAV